MSLDVYLEADTFVTCDKCGHKSETQREESYWRNITHNLGGMAQEAGIYKHLWRPEEVIPPIVKAKELIEPLTAGLALLKADPERFKKHNAANGWGLYEHFVPFVEDYLRACKESPNATVRVSR